MGGMENTLIKARCIVEILGAPKEFVVKKLREHVDELKENGLEIELEKYEEPKQQDKLFAHFVELQVAFKDVQELIDFCFDSMPSSIEVISPEKVELPMDYFEQVMNDFQAKLHHTDMLLKTMQAQKQVLDRNAINTFQNFIKFACKTKPHTIEELSELVGVGPKELKPFVDGLIEKGALKKEGEALVTDG